MNRIAKRSQCHAGFSLTELLVVLCGMAIISGIGVPVVGTMLDHYGVVLAAQEITSQMQFARMKAVSSNESLRVHFLAGTNSYQIETSTGALFSGPHTLPRGISYNAGDGGNAISFPGEYVTFLPTGNVPATGSGSAGRVKIINRSGIRVDVVVTPGGMVRPTTAYKTGSPPF